MKTTKEKKVKPLKESKEDKPNFYNFYKTTVSAPYYFKPNSMAASTKFNLRNVGGVYLIYKNDTLLYCGYSKNNVYRTMYRHFQDWEKSPQVRTIYKNLKDIKCRVIYCKNGKDAARLEKAIILKHKPKDNTNKYDQYNIDFKEVQIYDLVTGLKVNPIIVNNEETPF